MDETNTTAPPVTIAFPHSLTELIDDVALLTDGDDHPTLRTVLRAFGPAGALPVMMIVALIVVSPLSGIPLLPTISGLTIATIALQLAAGRDSLWLPSFVCSRSVPKDRLTRALDRLRPLARYLDTRSKPRLLVLSHPPISRLLMVFCALAGMTMPLLELVPLSSSLLALAITATGFILLTRDGLWAALAVLPVSIAVAIISQILF